MHCPKCDNDVQPVKSFSWTWTILTGGFYILYYLIAKNPDQCPICGHKL